MSFARPLNLLGLPIIALAALAGCSDPVAPPAQAAWVVTLNHDSIACEIASHNMMVGDINDHERKAVVVDGLKGNEVSCTVTGSSSFKVSDTSALSQGRSLVMDIPSISKNAKQASPVNGYVAYASEKTVDTYQPSATTPCKMYFADGTTEGVAAGKIWVAFDCQEVIAETSHCKMSGYALFENCATATE